MQEDNSSLAVMGEVKQFALCVSETKLISVLQKTNEGNSSDPFSSRNCTDF